MNADSLIQLQIVDKNTTVKTTHCFEPKQSHNTKMWLDTKFLLPVWSYNM